MWLVVAGWIAAALVFSAFFTTTMLRLRMIGIASNLAFMSYALLGLVYGDFGRLYPIFVLHAALLPLNISRLHQLRRPNVDDATPASICARYMRRRLVRVRRPTKAGSSITSVVRRRSAGSSPRLPAATSNGSLRTSPVPQSYVPHDGYTEREAAREATTEIDA